MKFLQTHESIIINNHNQDDQAAASERLEQVPDPKHSASSTHAVKILLKNTDSMSIRSLADLAAMVPERMRGEALNYGQGEGQLRIEESVWGFYVTDAGGYSFTLEEGVLSLEEASTIAIGIIGRVRTLWGSQVESEIRGCHHNDPEM